MDKIELTKKFKYLFLRNKTKDTIKNELKLTNKGYVYFFNRVMESIREKRQIEQENRVLTAYMLEAEMFDLIEKEKQGKASKEEVDEAICINLKYNANI